jgi:hypothetical protein
MPVDGEINPAVAPYAYQSVERHAPFPFRWVLPFGQLMVCVVLLWQARGIVAWSFGLHLPLPMLGTSGLDGGHAALRAAAALNLPAGLIQLPYDIFSPTHTEWMPAGMDSTVWRAVTWPVIGLVFWWLPGRGIEALSAVKYRQLAPRIGWTETIAGFLVMAAGATILIGFLFAPPADRADLRKFAAAGGLWALLGGLSVVARIAQWRLRRKPAGNLP